MRGETRSRRYRVVKEKTYHNGTWFYIEYYKKYLICFFNGWERLREDATVTFDMAYSSSFDDKQDVCFRSKKEANKYIKLL